jgi:hypothetical protein
VCESDLATTYIIEHIVDLDLVDTDLPRLVFSKLKKCYYNFSEKTELIHACILLVQNLEAKYDSIWPT